MILFLFCLLFTRNWNVHKFFLYTEGFFIILFGNYVSFPLFTHSSTVPIFFLYDATRLSTNSSFILNVFFTMVWYVIPYFVLLSPYSFLYNTTRKAICLVLIMKTFCIMTWNLCKIFSFASHTAFMYSYSSYTMKVFLLSYINIYALSLTVHILSLIHI